MELVLPYDDAVRPLPFYLAQEEWLAAKFPDRDFFFIWQVHPTVIIGRNQLLDKEVNTAYCRDKGIKIVRRRSGGGAVFADMNNIMFSYITSSSSVTTTFSAYTSMVARSLRQLGLDATDNSRNDILIGDRKVSGNSYYHMPGRSIVHGTMLYDYDADMMMHALTPPAVKLQSHGVASIRSRVTTIREHIPSMSQAEFKTHVLATIPDGDEPILLTADDVREIEEIERRYYAPGWLEGRKPHGTLSHSERIDGVGTMAVHMTVARGVISEISLSGDYLETADADALVGKALCGVSYDAGEITRALEAIGLDSIVPGLTPQRLTHLLI